MRSLLAIYLLLGVVASAAAQQIGQNKSGTATETYTLSAKVQLVVEAVVARDKYGKNIPGLTAKDFALTEDGTPQSIRFCEYENLSALAVPLPAIAPSIEDIKIYKRLAHTQIWSETPDNDRYKNHRLLAIYFDMSAMLSADKLRALAAAEQFIRTRMTTVDLVAILRYEGASVDILQDFTADRNKLLSILETLVVGEDGSSTQTVDDASSADTGTAFGQDNGEFNIFSTDRQLAALQTATKTLGRLNEKKSLIYFSSGLRLNGLDNQAQLHATVDAAVKAGVSFWPIDARGLLAEAPLGDASQGSPGNSAIYTGAAALATTSRFQQSQDTLYALAGDTGGEAHLDNNDLSRGIDRAQQAISDYYLLGYYTTNTAHDGHFRRIKVTLAQDFAANLSYRQGYYAEKEFGHFTMADKERQLEDALMLEDPITDLYIAMEIDYFQLNRAEYFVPISVKIPGRELALAKHSGAEHTQIDFIGEIKDLVGGTTVSNVRDNVNIKLTDTTAAEFARHPIEYDTGFTLLPGRYMIKFLARDEETGRIGTYQTTFFIPNLNMEDKRVPISSVVLSSQRVELNEVLFDAMKGKEKKREWAVNPLVQEGKKLAPSITRVFSTSGQMFVYLQAYKASQASATPESKGSALPVLGFVSFYRNGTKVFETPPTSVVPNAGSRLGTTPLSFNFDMPHLTPGEYDCQVTVLDPTNLKSAFWRAPIVLVP
jgi:VWFA-related protein